MVYRNTTIRGIPLPSTKSGGGGAPSQEGWAPATQGPTGQLLITLIALLTKKHARHKRIKTTLLVSNHLIAAQMLMVKYFFKIRTSN
jgi:hypothetical protein